jgi:hypothetical protein
MVVLAPCVSRQVTLSLVSPYPWMETFGTDVCNATQILVLLFEKFQISFTKLQNFEHFLLFPNLLQKKDFCDLKSVVCKTK